MHIGPRAVVRKAMRQGYYWPTMHADAKEEVDKCDSCQIHSPIPRLPKTHMTSIMAPWPFYQWGMDILGPLTPARGGSQVWPSRIIVHRTMAHCSVNGAIQLVVPPEIQDPTDEHLRTLMLREGNTHGRCSVLNLDLLQERREAAAIPGFRPWGICVSKDDSEQGEDEGKLGDQIRKDHIESTEGIQTNGSYKLQTMEDKVVPRTWHAVNLRKCYL
ncbi:reverse transcriptase domain-containing protein [Tanacetum coccineum]|uniref:Reverse transcriptase domain-containing protein n=1 Tax=Tanacetum coccineum TaxID=301880 RepID=A0ABQ5FYC1_9ASTR